MMELAVMSIDEGEEIVTTLAGGQITGTGRYKMIAKRKINGRYEWAHFMERDNGIREGVYRGEAKDDAELKMVIGIMNRNLVKIFGAHAEMKMGLGKSVQ